MTKTVIARTKSAFHKRMREFVKNHAKDKPRLISHGYDENTQQWQAKYLLENSK